VDVLALVLLIVWLLGIVVFVAALVSAIKDPKIQTAEVTAMRLAVEANPTATTLVLTLIILVWPVALVFSALKKGNK
jgi:hypothetical protein